MTSLTICKNCDNDAHVDGLCKDCKIKSLEAKVEFVTDVTMKIAIRNNEMVDEFEKKIKELELKVEVANNLFRLLSDSRAAQLEAPLYNLNPSFQQMVCVSGFIGGAAAIDLKDKLVRNDYWRETK